jgi:hypothetical protein
MDVLFEQFPHFGNFNAEIFELVAHVAFHGCGLFRVGMQVEKNADGSDVWMQ